MTQAKPILKYIGGKYKLGSSVFRDSDFEGITEYIEPFVGGCGSFCYVMQTYGAQIRSVKLYDSNEALIHLYQTVKDDPEQLIRELEYYQKQYDGTKEQFLTWRARFNEIIETRCIERAALFYVLNKTSFRGVYRVNQKGKYNVPFGNYKTFSLDPEAIWSLSRLFRESNAVLEVRSFQANQFQQEGEHTLVYLDPPYLDTFSGYQKESFGQDYHNIIKTCLDGCKCKWVLSNSDSEWIRTHFECEFIQAKRTINAKHPESVAQEVVTRKRKQS